MRAVHWEHNGKSPEIKGFVAVADSAFYFSAGVLTIIYGPIGNGLHAGDEYVVPRTGARQYGVLGWVLGGASAKSAPAAIHKRTS